MSKITQINLIAATRYLKENKDEVKESLSQYKEGKVLNSEVDFNSEDHYFYLSANKNIHPSKVIEKLSSFINKLWLSLCN